jgi:hypothetical protein
VGLVEARNRQVAAYTKGMRQRVKLAQATAHDPQVVLDEPLNGLDPLARAEAIALFERWGQGRVPSPPIKLAKWRFQLKEQVNEFHEDVDEVVRGDVDPGRLVARRRRDLD